MGHCVVGHSGPVCSSSFGITTRLDRHARSILWSRDPESLLRNSSYFEPDAGNTSRKTLASAIHHLGLGAAADNFTLCLGFRFGVQLRVDIHFRPPEGSIVETIALSRFRVPPVSPLCRPSSLHHALLLRCRVSLGASISRKGFAVFRVRAKTQSAALTFFGSVILFALVAELLLSSRQGWRWSFLLGAIPLLTGVCLLILARRTETSD